MEKATLATPRTISDGGWGTVVLPFGRYFAGKIDLLTRERYKGMDPIDGVSPFTAVGLPDDAMAGYAEAKMPHSFRDRVRADVRKDLLRRLAQSGADYLVVDNSSALLRVQKVNDRAYTVVPGERSDLMERLSDEAQAPGSDGPLRPGTVGLTDELKEAYDAFVDACLETFDPSRIILVRSHVARYWLDDGLRLTRTEADRREARLLARLDRYFVKRTGARIAYAAMEWFPTGKKWQAADDRLRMRLEEECVQLISHTAPPAPTDFKEFLGPRDVAARVAALLESGSAEDAQSIRNYFTNNSPLYDDLLALAYLQQESDAYADLVEECVRMAVSDGRSLPLTRTRQRFERSAAALREWPGTPFDVSEDAFVPQITVEAGRGVAYRFTAEGKISRVLTSGEDDLDVEAILSERAPLTPLNIEAYLRSWPIHLERGRRGVTAAPHVEVSGPEDLADSCYWLDWAQVLDDEAVVVTSPGFAAADEAESRWDLSFIFAPETRICAVGGGLMDQITHVALFNEVCEATGTTLYLDDFRYAWWRSHNGFEAARLAPDLESRRITRLISRPLLERFRSEVTAGIRTRRLPWLYNQSESWVRLGLDEAVVVSRNYPNSKLLLEHDPAFPVVIYSYGDQLQALVQEPPRPVTLFHTQHRVAIHPDSAPAIHKVFSYAELAHEGFPSRVAEAAKQLTSQRYVAVHVRRGDYMNDHFAFHGWSFEQSHYIEAIDNLIKEEGTDGINLAIFSDDLEFVAEHASDYGLDRVTGDVTFVEGNQHYDSIFDSYLMSLCPVIIGSVGFFSATTALLADPACTFIRAQKKDDADREKAELASGPGAKPEPAVETAADASPDAAAQPARKRRARDLIRLARDRAAGLGSSGKA